jgi:hypothetical protein
MAMTVSISERHVLVAMEGATIEGSVVRHRLG